MVTVSRCCYVISDLHVGGAYPGVGEPGSRGFRICTHVAELEAFVSALACKPAGTAPEIELVINGDFVDFLAEEWEGDEPWKPFVGEPGKAAARLGQIIERDRPFFAALKELLAAGHRLTVLLGNHDVELSFPEVRRCLEQQIAADGRRRFAFLYDGEAYRVGNAVIEHGNRYDGFNVIDHDGLRRLRSLQSRREPVVAQDIVRIPPGSRLVANVMNELKRRYPFIDLLKPEDAAAVPILLAMAPGARSEVGSILQYAAEAAAHVPGRDSQPRRKGDISWRGASGAPATDLATYRSPSGEAHMLAGERPALEKVLAGVLGDDAGREFLSSVEDAAGDASLQPRVEGISARSRLATLRLLLSSEGTPLEARLGTLRQALEALKTDVSFDRGVETKEPYLRAAERLISRGFSHVVFGHTHLAKQVGIEASGRKGLYLNTGTWADLMTFPMGILSKPKSEAEKHLLAFCRALEQRDLDPWIRFYPTYVRIDLEGNGTVAAARLLDYRRGNDL